MQSNFVVTGAASEKAHGHCPRWKVLPVAKGCVRIARKNDGDPILLAGWGIERHGELCVKGFAREDTLLVDCHTEPACDAGGWSTRSGLAGVVSTLGGTGTASGCGERG